MLEAEKQLAKYADEYYANEFVPHPTVQDAVDAILETGGYLDLGDRLEFVVAVAGKLMDWATQYEKDWGFEATSNLFGAK